MKKTVVALLAALSAFPLHAQPTLRPVISAAQRELLINQAMTETLIILDNAHLEPRSPQDSAILRTAIGQAVDHILTNEEMAGASDSEQASSIFHEVLTACASAASSAAAGNAAGGSAGGGLELGMDLLAGAGTAGEVTAASGGLAGALAAGAAVGAVLDGLYRAATGSSPGADLAAAAESYSQKDLDAAVQAAKDEAQKRENERGDPPTADKKEGDAPSSADSSGTAPSPAPSGTPNPDADGPHSGPAHGPAPSNGGGYADGREAAAKGTFLLREDLVAILTSGKVPLILFTPDQLAHVGVSSEILHAF